MASLILDLLRLQRLKETCSCQAEIKPVKISRVLQKCLEKLTPVINTKSIILNVSIDDFIYKGIRDQIEILLENIISNAVTYSHHNGIVEITSRVDANTRTATITITDHGIGIDPEDLPNIFNEYFYSPRAALHNNATSGLGLSIVKIAAQNNKLDINVASEPGKGTTFAILFPTVQLPAIIEEEYERGSAPIGSMGLGGEVFLPAMQMGSNRFGGLIDPTGGMFFLGSFTR